MTEKLLFTHKKTCQDHWKWAEHLWPQVFRWRDRGDKYERERQEKNIVAKKKSYIAINVSKVWWKSYVMPLKSGKIIKQRAIGYC